jgi:hypothetical protein
MTILEERFASQISALERYRDHRGAALRFVPRVPFSG